MTKIESEESFLPPPEVILRVLQSDGPYKDEAQKQACKKLFDELTDEEQEMAARTSYAYWVASTTGLLSDGSALDPAAVKEEMAMREARRHYVEEGENHETTLKRLRDTCQDRKERLVDVFRTCFREDIEYDTEEEAEMAKLYRGLVWDDLQKQITVVRGVDRDSHAVVVKFPRLVGGTTVEPYIAAQNYISERAIATTEILTEGKREKVMTVFDFDRYSSSNNAPPRAAILELVRVLQRNYPGRLKLLLILNAPFWMRMLFKLLYPFLSADTREKVRLASEDEVGPLIAEEHIGTLKSPVDLQRFFAMPFHELYLAPIDGDE